MLSNGSLQVRLHGLVAGSVQAQVQDQMTLLNRLNGFYHQEESDKKLLRNEIIIMMIAGMTMPDNKPYPPEYKGLAPKNWSHESHKL